jgi:hypothetical protein
MAGGAARPSGAVEARGLAWWLRAEPVPAPAPRGPGPRRSDRPERAGPLVGALASMALANTADG